MSQIHSLEDMLDAIRLRPEMWLPDKSLFYLEAMAHGYSVALKAHDISEFGTDFNCRFANFVFESIGRSTSRGWAEAIASNSASADAALEQFFLILDEFRCRTATGKN